MAPRFCPFGLCDFTFDDKSPTARADLIYHGEMHDSYIIGIPSMALPNRTYYKDPRSKPALKETPRNSLLEPSTASISSTKPANCGISMIEAPPTESAPVHSPNTMEPVRTTYCRVKTCGFSIEFQTPYLQKAITYLNAHNLRHQIEHQELAALRNLVDQHEMRGLPLSSIIHYVSDCTEEIFSRSINYETPISLIPVEIITTPTKHLALEDPSIATMAPINEKIPDVVPTEATAGSTEPQLIHAVEYTEPRESTTLESTKSNVKPVVVPIEPESEHTPICKEPALVTSEHILVTKEPALVTKEPTLVTTEPSLVITKQGLVSTEQNVDQTVEYLEPQISGLHEPRITNTPLTTALTTDEDFSPKKPPVTEIPIIAITTGYTTYSCIRGSRPKQRTAFRCRDRSVTRYRHQAVSQRRGRCKERPYRYSNGQTSYKLLYMGTCDSTNIGYAKTPGRHESSSKGHPPSVRRARSRRCSTSLPQRGYTRRPQRGFTRRTQQPITRYKQQLTTRRRFTQPTSSSGHRQQQIVTKDIRRESVPTCPRQHFTYTRSRQQFLHKHGLSGRRRQQAFQSGLPPRRRRQQRPGSRYIRRQHKLIYMGKMRDSVPRCPMQQRPVYKCIRIQKRCERSSKQWIPTCCTPPRHNIRPPNMMPKHNLDSSHGKPPIKHGSTTRCKPPIKHGLTTRRKLPIKHGSTTRVKPPIKHGSTTRVKPPIKHGSTTRVKPPIKHGSTTRVKPPIKHGSTTRVNPPINHGSTTRCKPPIKHGSTASHKHRPPNIHVSFVKQCHDNQGLPTIWSHTRSGREYDKTSDKNMSHTRHQQRTCSYMYRRSRSHMRPPARSPKPEIVSCTSLSRTFIEPSYIVSCIPFSKKKFLLHG